MNTFQLPTTTTNFTPSSSFLPYTTPLAGAGGADLDGAFSGTSLFDNKSEIPLTTAIQFESKEALISEDILKIDNIASRFTTLKQLNETKKKQLADLEGRIKEYKKSTESFSGTFTSAKAILFQHTIYSNEDMNTNSRKEAEVFEFYFMGMERILKQMEPEIESLKKELVKIDAELSVLYRFIQTGMKEIVPEENRKSHMCAVCIERPINSVLNPCGHTFCTTCTTSITSCPLCRQAVTTKIKMYIS